MYPIWLDFWKSVWQESMTLQGFSTEDSTMSSNVIEETRITSIAQSSHHQPLFDFNHWPFDTALCILDEELSIAQTSPNFFQVVGATNRQNYREFADLLDPSATKQFYYVLQQVLLSDSSVMMPMQRCQIRGSDAQWVQISGIRYEDGALLALRDISAEMQQERELARARINAELALRSRSEFLGRMSHELRTPLNAVIGFAQMIEKEMSGPLNHPVYEEYLRSIKESGEHLLDKINNLLAISEAELGDVVMNESDVCLSVLIHNASDHLQHYAFTRDVQLSLNCETSDSLYVKVDKSLMAKALSNLIENALSFTQPGGSVHIESELCEDGEVHIHVRDTGIGMGDNLVRCLQGFFQGEYSSCSQYEQIPLGTGLMLTREYLGLHDGSMVVRSEKGRGAVFTVCLPAYRHTPKPALPTFDSNSIRLNSSIEAIAV